ncbi:MAG: hypothetical protein R2860_05145 [Desulfobacterales bacterium]
MDSVNVSDSDTAVRHDVIRVKGTFENKPFIKGFKIDDHPWYQPLSYCLRCFIEGPEDTTTFWMIRPDTLDAFKFEARKQSANKSFPERAVKAIKVELD